MGEDICDLENDDNCTTKTPASNGHMSPIRANGKSDINEEHLLLNKQLKAKNVVSPTKSVKIACDSTMRQASIDDGWQLVPPDGGWGWLVLCGATLVNILIPGTIKSFGVLFVEFIEAFEVTPSVAAWIPALCYFLYSSLGPLSSILSVKYSYRTVTVVGGLFASVGMISTYFATSVGFLYISYGVFVGIGAGLSFPPTVYIVTSYFVRLRGLANGICISGSAIGSIILPPVLRYLLETFGYRGAILIMGGVTLNTLVAAIFYEPVEKHMKRIPKPQEMIEYESDKNCYEDNKIIEESEPSDSTSERFKNDVNGIDNKPRLAKFIITSDDTPVTTPTFEKKTDDIFRFPKNVSIGNGIRSVSAAAVQNYDGMTASRRERKISQPIREDDRNLSFVSPLSSTPSLHQVSSHANRLNRFNRMSGRPPKRSPSTSSFQYVSTPYHGSTLSALHPNEFASHLSLKSIASSLYPVTTAEAEKTGKKKFFDLSLLRDPGYLVILISNCTNAIGYTNFIILLPAYAITLGFDKSLAAYLLSIVSSLDLVGRIGGSALSDLNLIPKTWYFIGGLAVSGLALAILPFAKSYLMISIFCAFFGLASGTYVGITAVVMCDMLGTERLTSSYGISLFVNGILQLIGPPICGYIFEMVGSYQSLFTVLGLVLLGGASLWIFMPFINRNKRLKEERENQERENEENLIA